MPTTSMVIATRSAVRPIDRACCELKPRPGRAPMSIGPVGGQPCRLSEGRLALARDAQADPRRERRRPRGGDEMGRLQGALGAVDRAVVPGRARMPTRSAASATVAAVALLAVMALGGCAEGRNPRADSIALKLKGQSSGRVYARRLTAPSGTTMSPKRSVCPRS
jgi:hypothetical protein